VTCRAARPLLAALVLFLLAAPAATATAACIPARELFAVEEAAKVRLRQPVDLVLAGDRLYVLDDLNERVVILDRSGRVAGTVPLPGPAGASRLGLGFGGADRLFVAASGEGRVVVIDLAGKTVDSFAVGAAAEAGRPVGVLVSRATVFIADNLGHRVHAYALDGRELASWGGLGDGPGQFRVPWRIAQDSFERVLVTDALNSRILAFTPAGEQLLEFGEFGTTEGTLFRPTGLAVIEGDRIVVADGYFGSLQVFEPQGGYAGVLCGPEGKPLSLENPASLAARGRTVYVVETGAGRVRAFEIGQR